MANRTRSWLAVLALAGASACGGTAADPAGPSAPAVGDTDPAAGDTDPAAGDTEIVGLTDPPPCLFGMAALMTVSAGPHGTDHPAFAAAQERYDAADTAHYEERPAEAAPLFLDCARAYLAVPDGHAQLDTAIDNAISCYRNAAWSYAEAGLFASEGRAAIEAARVDDPRLADELDRILTDPPTDCAAP